MEPIFSTSLWILILMTLWVLPWKGFALWTAVRNSHKGWFIALLIINTLALLDIFYLIFVAKVFRKETNFKKTYSIANIRIEHSNAYRGWSKEDDKKLKELRAEGKSVIDIAEIFEREKGAISLRLKKLLVE